MKIIIASFEPMHAFFAEGKIGLWLTDGAKQPTGPHTHTGSGNAVILIDSAGETAEVAAKEVANRTNNSVLFVEGGFKAWQVRITRLA